MKIRELITKFRGSQKERANIELGQLAKSIAASPDMSIDAQAVAGILDAAGVDGEDLDSAVAVQRRRAGIRDELAGADAAIRESQSVKDAAVSKADRLQAEFNAAKVAAFTACDGHRLFCQKLADHRAYLAATASPEARQRLADARNRATQIGLKVHTLKKQLAACDVSAGRVLGDAFLSGESRAKFKADNQAAMQQLLAEQTAAQLECESAETVINNE